MVTGTVLMRLQPTKTPPRRDQTSIDRFTRRSLRLSNTWIHSVAAMTTRADALLVALSTPETRQALRWIVSDYADFAALELSDRIQVLMPGYTETAFIESIALNIPLDGTTPVCTLQTTVALGLACEPGRWW